MKFPSVGKRGSAFLLGTSSSISIFNVEFNVIYYKCINISVSVNEKQKCVNK